jgi:hypothetical protein
MTIGTGTMKTVMTTRDLVLKAETYQEVISYMLRNKEDLINYPTPELLLGYLVDRFLQRAQGLAEQAQVEVEKIRPSEGS